MTHLTTTKISVVTPVLYKLVYQATLSFTLKVENLSGSLSILGFYLKDIYIFNFYVKQLFSADHTTYIYNWCVNKIVW